MEKINVSPITLKKPNSKKQRKVICNEDCRDYEITFNLDNTKQRWVGSELGLLAAHPQAKIIKTIKLKDRKYE